MKKENVYHIWSNKYLIMLILRGLFLWIIIGIVNCDFSENKSETLESFLYISTDEGLISHYVQIELLWNIANKHNRLIKIAPMYSVHYNRLPVDICNVFSFPKNVTCSTEDDKMDMIEKKKCVILDNGSGSNNTWATRPSKFNMSWKSKPTFRVNFLNVSCVAGDMKGFVEISNKFKLNYLPSPVIPFQKNNLHEDVKKFIIDRYFGNSFIQNINDFFGIKEINSNDKFKERRSSHKQLAVFHWRRGDQLWSRCIRNNFFHNIQDHSVNCATVQEFIIEVNKLISMYSIPINSTIIYVATNEVNMTNLIELKKQHFVLISDLVENEKVQNDISKNSMLKNFLVELFLICHSNYVFSWGFSNLHFFIERCRNEISADSRFPILTKIL